jgi:hypothetical protein
MAYQCSIRGPVADLASLVGEGVGLEHVTMSYSIVEGEGSIVIGDRAEARKR